MEKRRATRNSEKPGYKKSEKKESGRFSKKDHANDRPTEKRRYKKDDSAPEKGSKKYSSKRTSTENTETETSYVRKSRSFDSDKTGRGATNRPNKSWKTDDKKSDSYERKTRFSDRDEKPKRPRRYEDSEKRDDERGYTRKSRNVENDSDRPTRSYKSRDTENKYERKTRYSDQKEKTGRSFRTKDSEDKGSERKYERKNRNFDLNEDRPHRSYRSKDTDDNSTQKPRVIKRKYREDDEPASKPYIRKSERESGKTKDSGKDYHEKEERSFNKKDGNDREWNKTGYENRLRKKYGIETEPEESNSPRSYKLKSENRSSESKYNQKKFIDSDSKKFRGGNQERANAYRSKDAGRVPTGIPEGEEIRLNKFIADSGICSRREADVLISTGAIMVNGQIVTELGTKVSSGDEVRYGDEILNREKLRYVLLNKPKDFITTTDDPQNRRTVMDLIEKACRERIYPVGRLDRMTTGLLLFTNDGALAKTLSHPSSNVQKVYHVELDKPLTNNDMQQIYDGITLEDGFIAVDNIAYASETTKNIVGVEIHSGKNRIVRRIFESLGYEVVKLDRVAFAGLTKKDLPRGSYRHLTEKEINLLRMKRYSY